MKNIWYIFSIFLFVLGLGLNCTPKNKSKENSILHVAITDLHYDYSWDIHKVRGLYTHLISYMIAEPPIRVNADGTYLPSIFKKWTFTENNTLLTVEISDDFKFHDGSKITADHVLNSILRALDSKVKQGGHNDLLNSLCEGDKCDIKKIGQNKIQFGLKRFTNAIVPSFTLSELSIFPDSYFKNDDKKSTMDNLSGPFQVVSFEPKLMKLKANKSHPLVNKDCPDFVYLHELKETKEIASFFKEYDNVVVFSAHANRAAKLKLEGASVKVFPPLIAEVIQLNRRSKKFKSKEVRKAVASKLFRSFNGISDVKKFTQRATQYFPSYSIAHIDDGVEGLYPLSENKAQDQVEISTYHELGFDKFFEMYKKTGIENNLKIDLKTLSKKEFFKLKNSIEKRENEPEAFYYFSGVGTANPIFEMTYMVERTNGGRYALPKVKELLEKARYEIDEKVYRKTLKEIHSVLLSEYLIVPLRYSSPVFHFKGKFKPADNIYTGELDFWNWTSAKK